MNEKNEAGNVLPFLRDQKPEGPGVIMELRLVHPETDRDEGRAVVAFDRRDPTMQLDLCRKETMEYLTHCLQCLVNHPGMYGMGAVLLGRLDLEKSKHWTAELLGLKRADDAMTDALLSALLGTIATSPCPVHLGSALFGIASFVHAHPKFAKILGPRKYEPPFGEDTDYTVCWI